MRIRKQLLCCHELNQFCIIPGIGGMKRVNILLP